MAARPVPTRPRSLSLAPVGRSRRRQRKDVQRIRNLERKDGRSKEEIQQPDRGDGENNRGNQASEEAQQDKNNQAKEAGDGEVQVNVIAGKGKRCEKKHAKRAMQDSSPHFEVEPSGHEVGHIVATGSLGRGPIRNSFLTSRQFVPLQMLQGVAPLRALSGPRIRSSRQADANGR